MTLFRRFGASFLNLLFPPRCAFCQREGSFLCEVCIKGLVRRRVAPPGTGKALEPPEWKHVQALVYGLDYAKNPAIKAALQQFKYRFTQELSEYFGAVLSSKLNEFERFREAPLLFVPVPLHPARLRERGFNQAELIARSVQKRFPSGQIRILPLLERVKKTAQQARLNREGRLKNLTGAFLLNKKFVQFGLCPGEKIFLVDDVCTTGSTLEAAAEALKKAGIAPVYGLAVARAFR